MLYIKRFFGIRKYISNNFESVPAVKLHKRIFGTNNCPEIITRLCNMIIWNNMVILVTSEYLFAYISHFVNKHTASLQHTIWIPKIKVYVLFEFKCMHWDNSWHLLTSVYRRYYYRNHIKLLAIHKTRHIILYCTENASLDRFITQVHLWYPDDSKQLVICMIWCIKHSTLTCYWISDLYKAFDAYTSCILRVITYILYAFYTIEWALYQSIYNTMPTNIMFSMTSKHTCICSTYTYRYMIENIWGEDNQQH